MTESVGHSSSYSHPTTNAAHHSSYPHTNATLHFQRPTVVGSSANTKFWFANSVKKVGNNTLLLAVSQGA